LIVRLRKFFEEDPRNPRLLKIIDAVTEKFGKGMLQIGPGRKAGE
jgi:hypothetical protein